MVIVNGVFVNGYMPFEPVYYFKPISGWGSVVRQYPGPFTTYLSPSNKVVRPLYAGASHVCVFFFFSDAWVVLCRGTGGYMGSSGEVSGKKRATGLLYD